MNLASLATDPAHDAGGMLGIFLVIGVIILAVYLLNKITGSTKTRTEPPFKTDLLTE